MAAVLPVKEETGPSFDGFRSGNTPHMRNHLQCAVPHMQYGRVSSDNSQQQARDHLWMHFTRHSTYATNDVPTIVRGDGAYIYDAHGKRYLDGLAGLFVVQAGHGRTELAEAAAKQAAEP